MRRQTVRLVVMLAFVILTAPLAANAQAPTKVYRVAKLLQGAKPAEALGLTLPSHLLVLADEVLH